MAYNEVINIEISCDFPGCDEWLLFGHEGWSKIGKMIHAINWTWITFPGEVKGMAETLCFCAGCKEKDPGDIKEHKCVYVRRTKAGKPSDYGKILECYYCEKIKLQGLRK